MYANGIFTDRHVSVNNGSNSQDKSDIALLSEERDMTVRMILSILNHAAHPKKQDLMRNNDEFHNRYQAFIAHDLHGNQVPK
jgi:hypothetical protein